MSPDLTNVIIIDLISGDKEGRPWSGKECDGGCWWRMCLTESSCCRRPDSGCWQANDRETRTFHGSFLLQDTLRPVHSQVCCMADGTADRAR